MILNKDFSLSRYGISARLVTEEDAEFIVKLRTDERLSRYLHRTDTSVYKQREWIRQYKERERLGKEYYFMFFINDRNLGVSRIYNINGPDEATGGSWVCSPDNTMEESIATILLERDIFFELLGFSIERFQVSKGNNQVLSFHKRMGAIITSEDDIEYQLMLTKESYYVKRNFIINILNI